MTQGATDCLLRDYQRQDGRIEVDWGGGSCEDYSSDCCPMIPIVDMANFLKDKDISRYVWIRINDTFLK